MNIASSPTEDSVRNVIELMIQMSCALFLFGLIFVLSVDGKPVDDEKTCGYEFCPVIDPEALNVHLVPHSHDDVGWLKTLDQYYFQDVQNVITSVVDALNQNPERRFVQVETAFFKKWWQHQSDAVKQKVIKMVNNGQLEIINGAWSMNDEAAVHYQSTIDQFTLGLRYLEDNLGKCSRPRVGWQIDPFGHSREQASIFAQLGFDSFFFARLDYRDKQNRLEQRAMDLLWRGSANLGNTSDIFTSVLYRHYSAPPGFCFDIVCNDEPIIDDPESPEYNYEGRVKEFADFIQEEAPHYPTNHLLITMGDDFTYEGAATTYINLDRLIKGFDLFEQTYQGKKIKVFYSTPSCYAKAVNDYVIAKNYTLPMKTDDFFPYADSPDTYWTGYFTSRPTSKHFERQGNNLLQVVKQLAANGQESYYNKEINSLKEVMGVMQHHDAITGTEKQHVADNYHFLLYRAMKSATEAASTLLSTLISGGGDDLDLDSCLLANISACQQTESDEFTVVVYNPLSHVVSTTVNLPVYTISTEWQVLAPDGSDIDHQIDGSLKDFGYVTDANTSPRTLLFVAKDLPPMGYKVYRLKAVDTQVKQAPEPNLSYVGYENTHFAIDEDTGLLKSVTMNGVTVDLKQQFEYYNSANDSGAYIFIPLIDETTELINSVTTVVSGNVSQGVLQEFAPWAKQFIRVYKDDPSYIEFDWVIGPLDIEDGGIEVITKYITSLENNGVFYTDSNGREMLKRTRNSRPDYKYTDEEPISGNYYPVNTRIVIKDEERDIELAVLTDRSQGGTSIKDGDIELMVHRATHSDDHRGVGENLDEFQYAQGIVVRGKHFLVVGPKAPNNSQKSLTAIQRAIVQRKTVAPWIFVTKKDVSTSLNILEWSGLTKPLPDNVHILTLEPWNDNTLLLRLEHFLEKGEDEYLSQEVTVDLSNLFTKFKVTELRETTLGGNIFLEKSERLHWPGSEALKGDSSVLSAQNRTSRALNDLKITLAPMQIRTFLATITYEKYL